MPETPTRDQLAEAYLEQLPYEPYPVQEEALLTYFTAEQGVLVCAPTGTGKTVIAEAALFEALHTGKVAYYTTPLIALTEQKYQEMRDNAERWGFSPDDVGMVTGNRKVNPHARILVVVAEILLNRLLNPEAFDFSEVSAVVMDEFHSFADRERGIVWELSLALLPKHVRLLLLSATVGNSREFIRWLRTSHGRRVELVEGTERRVPLTYQWVGDELLNEQITLMAAGDEETRTTPALVFCFNRDECWSVAEQLKGKSLIDESRRAQLLAEIERHNWSKGVGPKLRQMLIRGVGVHHAGMLPKYRRIVEDLYTRKLLSVCVCTETLAAGINLPARSVVITSLVKGPFGKKRLIDASSAHQIFGRAGRPQFDQRGYVFALAHDDDVKILRWKQKYDAIPEDTKDPGLLKAKKALKKKRPKRRENEQYWEETQFEKLKAAPPGNLSSRGPLPWRLLAYLLSVSPEVGRIQSVIHKRLMASGEIAKGEEALSQMLRTLAIGGYVTLTPEPPRPAEEQPPEAPPPPKAKNTLSLYFDNTPQARLEQEQAKAKAPAKQLYMPELATPTQRLQRLLVFKSVNPLYGDFLVNQLDIASEDERIQALESVMELPGSMLRKLRVPGPDELPPGPLETTRLNEILLRRGLIVAPAADEDQDDDGFEDDRPRQPPLAEKLRLLFDSEFPRVEGIRTQSVWAAGELLRFGGDFNKYVTSHDLAKQEGIIFRHTLRLILLCGEFAKLAPAEGDAQQWQAFLRDLSERLTAICRQVDPESTDKMIEEFRAADIIGIDDQ